MEGKAQTEKFVYDFAEGNKDLKDLLGGKGANLAEMTNLGLPVHAGFTITTGACRRYLADGKRPAGLDDEIAAHLTALESTMGRRLGDPADPLLVSVRSGAKFSMPGMMETVLNVGLNDDSVAGLSAQAGGNDRFAWDSYRRLIQMFGKTVCEVPGEEFESALSDAKSAKGVRDDVDFHRRIEIVPRAESQPRVAGFLDERGVAPGAHGQGEAAVCVGEQRGNVGGGVRE